MRCYNHAHRFYAGVDLHARSLYTHILDATGRTVLDRDLPAQPAAFLDAVNPKGVELAVLLDRSVGTKEVSEASLFENDSPFLEWGNGPDLVKLFGAASLRTEADTAGVNHPEVVEIGPRSRAG